MQKKELLSIEIPPIVGYLHHAYHLTIAQNHPLFEQWFYSNYIQLKYYPQTNWLNFFRIEIYLGLHDYCPLLEFQILNNETIKQNEIRMVNFVIRCIQQGYYVWLYIDEYYDSNRRNYNKNHLVHENLVYGYNLDENCFYSVGFDAQSNYDHSVISFMEFEKAFYSVEQQSPIKIIKPNPDATYKFDIDNLKNLLSDYLYSENTSCRNRMYHNPTTDAVYGLKIYDGLKVYFEALADQKTVSDIRPLHILWEHKKCMALRLKYLYDNKFLESLEPIYSAYVDIEQKALILRNLQLRYEYGDASDTGSIKKIIASLDEIRNSEKKVLTELLNCNT